MKINLVNRDNGRAVVLWRNVLLAALLLFVAGSAGILAFFTAVGWYSWKPFFVLFLQVGVIVGFMVRSSLQPSPAMLAPRDPA